MKTILLILVFLSINYISIAQSNPGDVVRYKKIGNNLGGLGNVLGRNYYFGSGMANIGDINGDGITDMAAGIHGKSPYGGLYILFMDTNGTVQSKTLLTQNTNGISGLSSGGLFGMGITGIGDINNDGTPDIIVGALGDNDGGVSNTGAIYIICLDSTGSAISQNKISKTTGLSTTGGLPIQNNGHFGCDLGYIGDINNDGNIEIAVGNSWDDQSGQNYGAFWILSIDSNKKVSSYYKIRKGVTNFNPAIDNDDYFGQAVSGIGDFNNDGIPDVAVSAIYDDDGNGNAGAFYIINLDTNSHIKSYTKISNNSFPSSNPINGTLGTNLAVIPDIFGDGHPDIIAGADRYPYTSDYGAVYIFDIDSLENVNGYKIITYPEITNPSNSRLGRGLCSMNDYNSDGYPEIAVNAPYENGKRGTLYMISLYTPLTVQSTSTSPQCHGDSTGMIAVAGSGVNPPFTFLWNTGSTNDTLYNLPAGSYSVTMTNSLGATAIRNIQLTEPPAISISTSTNTSVCSGSSTTLLSHANGGTGTKTIHWNNSLGIGSSKTVYPNNTTTYFTYATDANNCYSDTNSITITVNPLPTATFSGLNVAYCSNATATNLSGSPTGGLFSGPGISGNVFNPANANIGNNDIIYSYTDMNGCVGKDTNSTTIIATPNVVFSGLSAAYCSNDAAFNLVPKASPAGGSFFVNSISSTNFNPTNLGPGTYHIRYEVSNSSGCSDMDSFTTFVNPAPTASFSGLATTYCENSLSTALNGSPAGGSFIGSGISGTSFYPSNAGLGTKEIKYIYSNMFGCSDTAVHSTLVNAITPLSISTPKNIFCNNDAAVSITISPNGGTLSGSGVNNSTKTFDPTSAGVGAITITYTFINPHGCTSVETHNVSVNTPASLSISGLANSYCANSNSANLTGSPAGGTFFGMAVNGNIFNPTTAGVGTHTVSYRYDNGCVDTLQQNVTVYGLPTVTISGLASTYCSNDNNINLIGSPSGGIFYGTAVNSSTNVFSPSIAGPGNHSVSYISPTDTHGCKDTAKQIVNINAIPVISFGTILSDQCITNTLVNLSASPGGGSFAGASVSANTFNPSTAGAGTHKIYYSVTDANICSNTDSFTFIVHNLPTITFNVGSSCANITAVNLSAAPSGGSFSGSFVSGSVFNPAAAGVGPHQVSYSYTDSYSCSNADTQTIVVNTIPNVNFSISNTDFCIDENSINLSATPSGGNFTGNGINGNSFSPVSAGAGSHNLVYTFTDGNLCSNSDTAIAIVHALPTVSISNYNAISCSNNPKDTLTGLPSGGSFAGIGMTDSVFNPITAGVGTHQIVYAYTDAYQCENSDTASIIVYAAPSLVISSGMNATNCKNDAPYALVITPAGGSYSGNFVVNDTFYPNLAPTGYMGYIYMYTDANGCSGVIGDSAFVYDNPTVEAGRDTLLPCGSNGTTIGEIAEANHTYLWTPYAGLNNPFIANPVANPWVDTTVFVVVKTNILTSCSSKDSVIITLPQPLTVTISGDTVVCFGDSVHLMASGPDSVLWRYNQSGHNFNYLLHITQYIQAKAIDSNNCMSWDSVLVLVNPLPQPDLGADTAIFDNQVLTLNAGAFTNYQWNTGETTQSINVAANSLTPGNYTYSVAVENNYGCSNSDTIIISITTGINTADLDLANIRVYPNPTKGKLFLEWAKEDLVVRALVVYNAMGQKVMSKEVSENDTKTFINLSTMPKGLFYVKVVTDSGERTFKVVVD